MKPVITVIGTVFVDCKGISHIKYDAAGRNLGEIEFVHGGVGRNIAETLGMLSMNASFVSMVDDSALGAEIIRRLEEQGVSTAGVGKVDRGGMGFFLAIVDDRGDLAGSISQIPDLTHLEAWCEQAAEEQITQADAVCLEIDLNLALSSRLLAMAAKHQKPVYGIPGNLDVIMQQPELLRGLELFICNDIEASRLSGSTLDQQDHELALKTAQHLAEQRGIHTVVITLGQHGAVYYDTRSGTAGHEAAKPVRPVDTTGAGDAFFSGVTAALASGTPIDLAVQIGTQTAAWTVMSSASTCPDLREKAQRNDMFRQAFNVSNS